MSNEKSDIKKTIRELVRTLKYNYLSAKGQLIMTY